MDVEVVVVVVVMLVGVVVVVVVVAGSIKKEAILRLAGQDERVVKRR